jgi:hypothetical protein
VRSDAKRQVPVAKAQAFPFIFSSAFTAETGAWLSEAGSGAFAISRIICASVDQLRMQHGALVRQGLSPLNATDYLLKQIEGMPAQPLPQAAPQFPSPFQAPINGQPHVRP